MAAIATKSEMRENNTNEKNKRIMQNFLLKIMPSMQNMQNFLKTHALLRKILPFITIFVITGLVTIFFFSNLYLSYSSKNYAEKQLALVNASIPDSSSYNAQTGKKETKDQAHIVGNTINIPTSGSDVILSDINSATKAIKIELEQTKPVTLVTGTVEIEDFGIAPNAYTLADSFQMSTGKHNTRTLRFESHGDAYKVRLHFNQTGAPFTLKAVTVNPPFALHINFGMWAILFVASSLIFLVYKKKWYLLNYDRHNLAQNIVFWAVCAMLMGFSLYLCFVAYRRIGIKIPFPTDNYDYVNNNQYTKQLEAWKNNSLSFITKPPQELINSTNPYSIGERNLLGSKGVYSLFDTVLYEGKYYSYFGITPLILCYLPFNLVFSHSVPSALLVGTMLALACIPTLFALLREIVTFFNIRANYLLMLFCAAALPFSCLTFYLQVSSCVYYLPLLSSLLFGSLFVYFALKATRLRNSQSQYIYFAFAGISLVLQCGSRPNACIPVIALVAPIFIAILFSNLRSLCNKIIAASCFLTPVIFGTAALLFYNYLRFGSLFNFGNNYQLTAYDVRYQHITFDPTQIKDMIVNYWFMPLKVLPNFPYIAPNIGTAQTYGNVLYIDIMFGILCIPLSWGLFLTSKKILATTNLTQKFMIGLGLTSSILLMYMNYCLGGCFYRYYCDSLLIIMIIASIFILSSTQYVLSKDLKNSANDTIRVSENILVQKLNKYNCARLRNFAIICCLLTIILGILLVFSNHGNGQEMLNLDTINPDLFLKWSDLFSIGR